MKVKHQILGLFFYSTFIFGFVFGSESHAACPKISGTYECNGETFEISKNIANDKSQFISSGFVYAEDRISLGNGAWNYISTLAKCTPETVSLYFGTGFTFVEERCFQIKEGEITLSRLSAQADVYNEDFSTEEEKFKKLQTEKYGEKEPTPEQGEEDYRKFIQNVGVPYWEKFKQDKRHQTVTCTKKENTL